MSNTMDTKPTPLYLTPVEMPAKETLRPIRSKASGMLLAWEDDEGLYLYDRRSRQQHFLAWSDVQANKDMVE